MNIAEYDMQCVDIFDVGNDTIDRMNSLSSYSIEDTHSNKMVNIIEGLKRSVDRFHSYSNIGYFKKLFTSAIEIEANIKIAHVEFETLLKSGNVVSVMLKNQYASFGKLYKDLKETTEQFNEDIKLVEEYINSDEASASDIQRLMRRRDDLISAQILSNQTAMQYDLCKNNVGILMDKFSSIEKVLKPALEQNMKFSKSEFKNVF